MVTFSVLELFSVLFCALSLCASVYSVYRSFIYDTVRIRSAALVQRIDLLEADLKSLKHSTARKIQLLEDNTGNNSIDEILKNLVYSQLGVNANQEQE